MMKIWKKIFSTCISSTNTVTEKCMYLSFQMEWFSHLYYSLVLSFTDNWNDFVYWNNCRWFLWLSYFIEAMMLVNGDYEFWISVTYTNSFQGKKIQFIVSSLNLLHLPLLNDWMPEKVKKIALIFLCAISPPKNTVHDFSLIIVSSLVRNNINNQ